MRDETKAATSSETASARYASIENWSTRELVTGIIESQFAAIGAVQQASPALTKAIDAAAERLRKGGRLIYMGAGTSGRIATQDGAELPPTFNWPYERAISLMAGGERALKHAIEGAEDSEEAAIADLKAVNVAENDVVIGLAASGNTPYTASGLAYARSIGALSIGILNNAGGRVGAVSEIEVLIETGPELLAGSTRMKAGTAQKAALNCLSTGVMIKLGFVYRGLMVEMRPTNVKLRERAILMVAELTGAEKADAEAALDEAEGVIKLATVMLSKSIGKADAQAALDRANGNLRQALI